MDVNIWGWASPGEKLSIEFRDKTYTTTANKDGEWAVKLPPMKSGGPYEMKISASNELKVRNILIGDVWIISGQSNMELSMKRVKPVYEEIIAQSENPNIRHFDVPDRYNFNQPQDEL